MSGSATDYLENAALSHALGVTAWAMPATIYVALCRTLPAPPNDANPGAEIGVGLGYARGLATFSVSGGGATAGTNTSAVSYGPATADWGDIGYYELWDAVSGGHRLFYGTLTDPTTGAAVVRTVLRGDEVRFAPGTLVIGCD